VRLIVSDKCLGLVESLGECYRTRSGSGVWSTVRATLFTRCRRRGQGGGGDAQSDPCPGRSSGGPPQAEDVVEKLEAMRLAKAAKGGAGGVDETLGYMAFRQSTGVRSARTIPWSESCGRSSADAVVGAFPTDARR